jgi:hypothetical protein
MRTLAAVLGSLLGFGLAGGCGYQRELVPTSAAERLPDRKEAAIEDQGGVRMTIDGDSWPSDTIPLGHGVTPVLVTIDNHSGGPVLVRREDFALQGDSGHRYAALPPAEVLVPGSDKPVTIPELLLTPAESMPRDHMRPLPPGPNPVADLSRWETSFPYNPYFFKGVTIGPEVRKQQPLARALPEGTLPDGARAAGFVYFAAAPSERRALFEAQLLKNADTSPNGGVGVARATIPMRFK